LNKSLVQIWLP